jgi:outer membrane protein TolC
MVGPGYVRPPAPTAVNWIETNEPAVKDEPTDVSAWWTVFQDPVLNALVETAYRQNPSLRAAGVRVLEAQAQRGIALSATDSRHSTTWIAPPWIFALS